MKIVTISNIQNVDDVKLFFEQLTEAFGLNWHVEDDFDDEKLNFLIEKSYAVCKDEDELHSLAFNSMADLRQQLNN